MTIREAFPRCRAKVFATIYCQGSERVLLYLHSSIRLIFAFN
jgi:hypothetical protein